MRLDESMNALRVALLVAMGLPPAGCGGDVVAAPGAGGASAANGSGVSTAASSTAGSGGAPAGPCKESMPIIVDGVDTGFAKCGDGTVHKPAPSSCSTVIKAPGCQGTETVLTCKSDAECTSAPLGKCVHFPSEAAPEPSCNCVYPCGNDAECGPGKACVCDGVTKTDGAWPACADGACATDQDCASGECGLSSFNNGCYTEIALACRTAADACRVDADCPVNNACAVLNGAWVCRTSDCAIGRPLLVDGTARAAAPVPRGDWADVVLVDVDALAPRIRAALAARWTEIGAMEHASVASFARFTLQLLAAGAPADLVAEAQRAAADEVEHARLAYGLASTYANRPVGPGSLDVLGVEIPGGRRRMVVELIEEACVGETLGSLEATLLASRVRDPALRAVHARIARDELRHAELAWKTLRWLLSDADAETRTAAREAFERAIAAAAKNPESSWPDAPEHGLLDRLELGRIRRDTLRQVVAPAAEAALGFPAAPSAS